MFLLAKRSILLPVPGAQPVHLARDCFATVPDAVAETPYFRALVADGKISVPASHSDQAVQAAAEKPVKTRRAKTGG